MIKESMNRDWQFFEGEASWFGERDATKKVDLPHDFIVTKPRGPSAAGGPSNGFFGEGQGTYRKAFDLPEAWKGKQVILDIDGAYMNAEVWLNGELLAMHPYGYTPYLVNLTPKLRDKNNNLKIVTLSMQPSTRWYSGGGLYRGVSAWTGGCVYASPWDIFVTTPKAERDAALINADITVTNTLDKPVNAHIHCDVLSPGGEIAAEGDADVALEAGGKGSVNIRIPLSDPNLWDIDSPCLYTLKTAIAADGAQTDESAVSFGVRKIEVSPKTGFLLNGRELKLKGGCIHHDNGQLGACAYPRAEERKIEILKDAGYNAVRISHYPPSLAMLEVCDRKGMLLLDEAFDAWRMGMKPLDYHLYFEDWWERDISYMVMRDRNHPCVITYSIGNEIIERDGRSDGALWSRRLSDKIRSLDNTRFVTSAICDIWPDPDETETPNLNADPPEPEAERDVWGERTAGYIEPLDIVGYNYLFGRYASDGVKFPNRVICGTETHSFNTYDFWQATLENKHVIGDFIWVAYDNLGEVGVGRTVWGATGMPPFFAEYPWRTCYQGDHDICGFRLPQSYYRKIMWGGSKEPALFTTHPKHYGQPFTGTGWHWYDVLDSWTYDAEYIGRTVSVQAYGDGDEAEFILNGVSMGRAPIHKLIASMDIPYAPGTLEAVVYSNGEVWGKAALVTAGPPAAVEIRADRPVITGDSLDLCYITINIVDAEGRRVPADETKLVCAVSAPGILAGFGSGSPACEDPFGDCWCHAFEGRAMAIVKAGGAGAFQVMVSGEDIKAASVIITAV